MSMRPNSTLVSRAVVLNAKKAAQYTFNVPAGAAFNGLLVEAQTAAGSKVTVSGAFTAEVTVAAAQKFGRGGAAADPVQEMAIVKVVATEDAYVRVLFSELGESLPLMLTEETYRGGQQEHQAI